MNCLLVHPQFGTRSFSLWNFREASRALGAKTLMPPLGLITMAAMLPSDWKMRLLDLNVRLFSQDDWDWADIVFVGGMLPQQHGILEIVELANSEGKFVVVGGSDPTNQPTLYENADALVLGEAEASLPLWLSAWRNGEPRGVFRGPDFPDMEASPMPRFDLLDYNDYVQVGVQWTRGCPFNCEFCDIIEVFGRKPRSKHPEQMLAELQALYEMGYRGGVFFVDDNFIGNKKAAKVLLNQLSKWSADHDRPFYFITEATMNLADDPDLLCLMQEAGFNIVFTGIETPDNDVLKVIQKKQNTTHPIVERVQKINDHGIAVAAGFVIGFDGEEPGMDQKIINCMEDTNICMAGIELLCALPNTQLMRRLLDEGRIHSPDVELAADQHSVVRHNVHTSLDTVNQTILGLNFDTDRDRSQILDEYENIARTIYEPGRYLKRALRAATNLKNRKARPISSTEWRRWLKAFWYVALIMTLEKDTRYHFWKNFLQCCGHGLWRIEPFLIFVLFYLDLKKHRGTILSILDKYRHSGQEGKRVQKHKSVDLNIISAA